MVQQEWSQWSVTPMDVPSFIARDFEKPVLHRNGKRAKVRVVRIIACCHVLSMAFKIG